MNYLNNPQKELQTSFERKVWSLFLGEKTDLAEDNECPFDPKQILSFLLTHQTRQKSYLQELKNGGDESLLIQLQQQFAELSAEIRIVQNHIEGSRELALQFVGQINAIRSGLLTRSYGFA